MPNNTIDPTIKALTSAIAEAETGSSSPEAYTKRGASGEFGRYQFMPDTWKAYAGEAGVSTSLEQSSMEEQNKVAYNKIKQWKDQGYTPAQIASMWNAGPGRPNAYKENWKGVNSQGVAYDTPSYAMKVSEAYNRLKGQSGVATTVPRETPQEGGQGYMNDIGQSLSTAGGKLASAVGDAASGEINPLSGVIRSAGAIGGAVGDITTDVLENTPVVKDIYKGVEGLVGNFAQGIADTEAGQNAIKGYQSFAEEHPELAGNISAGMDIVTAIPILKGLKVVKNKAGDVVNNALHGKTDAVYDTVSPPLTPKKTAQAISERGTETTGLLRDTRLKNDPFYEKVSDAVKANVPKFNPNKPLLYNIDATQTVVRETNKQLKQRVQELGRDRIYSFKELGSALNNLDVPDIIAAEPYLLNLHNRLVGHALRIAKAKGGKVPNLLDVRQEFDRFVKKQYPNVFNQMDRTSPLSATVKQIRNALTDFTVKNLPEDALLKETLSKEHLLLEAIESMATRASKGADKEIGTDAISRFGTRHPVVKGLAKSGGNALIQGAGLGGVMKIMD